MKHDMLENLGGKKDKKNLLSKMCMLIFPFHDNHQGNLFCMVCFKIFSNFPNCIVILIVVVIIIIIIVVVVIVYVVVVCGFQ